MQIRRRLWIAITASLLLASGCSTPDGNGNGNGADPAANLIVAGERIGDLPPIGTAGSVIRQLPYDSSLAITVPPATSYRFTNEEQQLLYSISVCASNDLVWLVNLQNMPENERFATSEGVGVGSSESEVVTALGDPERLRELSDRRLFDYAIDDGVPGLSIAFDADDATRALYLGVATRCEE